MIVERIELENFMCYAGMNSFEFSEGMNVIIGDNGYGKSKLYDAFYWVMYDMIFIPERKEFQKTQAVKRKLISDKALAEQTEGNVTARVQVTFHDLRDGNDRVFILERKYSVSVSNLGIVESRQSEFNIMEKELSYLSAKLVTDEEKKASIIRQILPTQIKDYLWFQGEQVESIIDFNKQDSLTKAINVLSNISYFDKVVEIANNADKAAKTEYDREVRKRSTNKEQSDRLGEEKSKLEAELVNLQSELVTINNNLSKAEEKCENLLHKVGDANQIRDLQTARRGKQDLLNEFGENLKAEQFSFHRKLFRNKWVLKGTKGLQTLYAKQFSDYEKRCLEIVAEATAKKTREKDSASSLQTRLPFNVPEPNYIEWMLDKEKCLVCNREAKRDSEPWKEIKSLLDRKDDRGSNAEADGHRKQDFSGDLKKLYQNGLALSGRIQDIDDDIAETLKKRNAIVTKIKKASSEIEGIENSIQKLLSETSITETSVEDILSTYAIQRRNEKEFTERQNKISQQIEFNRVSLAKVEAELSSLTTGAIPKWLSGKKEVLEDFVTIAQSTRNRVFEELIQTLEKEANEHYAAMTKDNKAARGKIRLYKLPNGNYMPEIINEDGVPLLGINTSNLILVKLAAIMAIISARSRAGKVNLYTLIADAPTSVFGEDYTIGFSKCVSKVYRQSIIMSKEFYKNVALREQLLNNAEIRIGKVYTVTPSISERERVNRNSLSTIITPLN